MKTKNILIAASLLLSLIPFDLVQAKGRSFRIPQLNTYTKNLISIVSTGTPEERIRAIQECGYSHFLVCYYPLVEALSDEDPAIRSASSFALGILRIPESLEHLTKALREEKDKKAQESMLFALGLLENSDGASVVAEFLTADEMRVRRAAAIALGKIASPETKDAVLEALKSEDVDLIHVELVYAILKVDPGNSEMIRELIGHLFNQERLVRFSAAQAAGDLKIKETLTPLQKAITFENDEMVRRELIEAYRQVLYE